MKNLVVKSEDKIVQDVCQLLDSRSVVGVKKYKTTLEQNNTDNFLQHALEEALDLALYLQKLISLKDEGAEHVIEFENLDTKEKEFWVGKLSSLKAEYQNIKIINIKNL